jgi:hypothetical protein
MMTVADFLSNPQVNWVKQAGASPESVERLASVAPLELPKAYLDLLLFSNGGEGDLGIEPGWFQLWSAETVIDLNDKYQVQENVPGFFAFGSNGGGEMLALDGRSQKPPQVAMVPFIPMEKDEAMIIAPDFETFIRSIGIEYEPYRDIGNN